MNNTSILTWLGLLIAVTKFMAESEIFPMQSTFIGAIATAVFGLLAKGTEKKTWK